MLIYFEDSKQNNNVDVEIIVADFPIMMPISYITCKHSIFLPIIVLLALPLLAQLCFESKNTFCMIIYLFHEFNFQAK